MKTLQMHRKRETEKKRKGDEEKTKPPTPSQDMECPISDVLFVHSGCMFEPHCCTCLVSIITDRSIAPQHAFHQIAQRSPEVFATASQTVLVDEQHVVLETRVEMRFEAELDDDGVVMAIYVRIHAVEALEHVADEGRKCLGERDADAAREHLFVVYVGLYPGHEVLDVFRGGHLGGLLVVFAILPQVLKPRYV